MSLADPASTTTLAASPAVKMEQPDSAMTDVPNPPLHQAESSSTHTASTATMPRNTGTNGTASVSSPVEMPKEAARHGAPTRDWLNTKVTGVLLEGMKILAAERPEAPLQALGEWLLKRSAEIEGTGMGGEDVNGQKDQ